MSEHLRVSGIYWGLTSLCILGKIDVMNKEETIQFVKKCYNDDGGYIITYFIILIYYYYLFRWIWWK